MLISLSANKKYYLVGGIRNKRKEMNCYLCNLLFVLPYPSYRGSKMSASSALQRNIRCVLKETEKRKAGVHRFSRNMGATTKFLCARKLTWSIFHIVNPKILGGNVENWVNHGEPVPMISAPLTFFTDVIFETRLNRNPSWLVPGICCR